jgi:hypothetical protein
MEFTRTCISRDDQIELIADVTNDSAYRHKTWSHDGEALLCMAVEQVNEDIRS